MASVQLWINSYRSRSFTYSVLEILAFDAQIKASGGILENSDVRQVQKKPRTSPVLHSHLNPRCRRWSAVCDRRANIKVKSLLPPNLGNGIRQTLLKIETTFTALTYISSSPAFHPSLLFWSNSSSFRCLHYSHA